MTCLCFQYHGTMEAGRYLVLSDFAPASLKSSSLSFPHDQLTHVEIWASPEGFHLSPLEVARGHLEAYASIVLLKCVSQHPGYYPFITSYDLDRQESHLFRSRSYWAHRKSMATVESSTPRKTRLRMHLLQTTMCVDFESYSIPSFALQSTQA